MFFVFCFLYLSLLSSHHYPSQVALPLIKGTIVLAQLQSTLLLRYRLSCKLVLQLVAVLGVVLRSRVYMTNLFRLRSLSHRGRVIGDSYLYFRIPIEVARFIPTCSEASVSDICVNRSRLKKTWRTAFFEPSLVDEKTLRSERSLSLLASPSLCGSNAKTTRYILLNGSPEKLINQTGSFFRKQLHQKLVQLLSIFCHTKTTTQLELRK